MKHRDNRPPSALRGQGLIAWSLTPAAAVTPTIILYPHARTLVLRASNQAMCNLLHTDSDIYSRHISYLIEKIGGQGGN